MLSIHPGTAHSKSGWTTEVRASIRATRFPSSRKSCAMSTSGAGCSASTRSTFSCDIARGSGRFDDRRQALADADAHGGNAEAAAAVAELVGECADEARARAAERVADGDRAAVDVELLVGDAELAHAGDDLGGEGLVDLDQVD